MRVSASSCKLEPAPGGVAKILKRTYKDFAHNNLRDPLWELMFLICSIQTTEANYRRTFRALKQKYSSLSKLGAATEKGVAAAIRLGGLSKQKAKTIKRLVGSIKKHFGHLTLEPLRKLDNEKCENLLTGLFGVGTNDMNRRNK